MSDENKKPAENFEDPQLLDLEDLQDVSGGCLFNCDTGGSSSQERVDSEEEETQSS